MQVTPPSGATPPSGSGPTNQSQTAANAQALSLLASATSGVSSVTATPPTAQQIIANTMLAMGYFTQMDMYLYQGNDEGANQAAQLLVKMMQQGQADGATGNTTSGMWSIMGSTTALGTAGITISGGGSVDVNDSTFETWWRGASSVPAGTQYDGGTGIMDIWDNVMNTGELNAGPFSPTPLPPTPTGVAQEGQAQISFFLFMANSMLYTTPMLLPTLSGFDTTIFGTPYQTATFAQLIPLIMATSCYEGAMNGNTPNTGFGIYNTEITTLVSLFPSAQDFTNAGITIPTNYAGMMTNLATLAAYKQTSPFPPLGDIPTTANGTPIISQLTTFGNSFSPMTMYTLYWTDMAAAMTKFFSTGLL